MPENKIIRSTDYSPFGTVMYGRDFTFSSGYKYGFNGKEKDDEVKTGSNSYDFGARIYDPRLGRWLSIDQSQIKYPHISSYAFVKDNPLYFVDPDGKEVKISGEDAKAATAALQSKTSLVLHYDAKTNMLTCTGAPKTALDQKLYDAIKDKNVTVNLKTTSQSSIPTSQTNLAGQKGKFPIRVGAFDGNKVGVDGKIETSQFVNIKQAEIVEKAGGHSVGTSVVHELLESYIAAKDNPGMTSAVGPVNGPKFNLVHEKTVALDSKFEEMSLTASFTLKLKNGKEVDIKMPTQKSSDTPEKK